MILDTSFLVDVLRGEETVQDAVRSIDEGGTAQVSPVTVMELWEEIHLVDSSDRERGVVKNLLGDVRELPFDRECATTAGEINATLRQNDAPIDDADVMIAATALVNDVPVVTDNLDHFERIDGLEIRTY